MNYDLLTSVIKSKILNFYFFDYNEYNGDKDAERVAREIIMLVWKYILDREVNL